MEKLYQKLGIVINEKGRYETVTYIKKRVKNIMKKRIKEIAFSEENEEVVVQAIKEWSEQLQTKAQRKNKS